MIGDLTGRGEATTTNLTCRRPGTSVAENYLRLFTEPVVEAWIRPEPMNPFTTADIERMARRDHSHWEKHGYGPWEVRERESGAFVGRGGLAWVTVAGEPAVELPWAVIPSLQGRGYATEMARAAISTAREAGIERVVSLTLPENRASRRVMEKAGLGFLDEIRHVGMPHVLYELNL